MIIICYKCKFRKIRLNKNLMEIVFMKRNKKNKLIVGLTTLILTTSGLFVTTTFTGNVVKAEQHPVGYNRVLPDNTRVIGEVNYKEGSNIEEVWRDLGFRGVLPYGNKMIPQKAYSTPRARASVYLHTHYTMDGSLYASNGSGVFIAPNIMLTVAHNYLRDTTKELKTGLRGHAYVGGTYLFPSEYYKSDNYPDPSRIDLPTDLNNVFFRPGAYGDKYEPVSTYDIAVVKFPRPIQLAVKGAKPRPIVKTPDPGTIGQKIINVGYPASFQANTGVLIESRGEVIDKPYARSLGVYPMTGDIQGGNSGGGVFNENDEVIGSVVAEFNRDGIGNAEYNGYTPLDSVNHAWVKGLVDKYALKGWYNEGGKRYYFDEDGQMPVSTTKVINDREYRFDSDGAMVEDLGPIKRGTIKIKYVDKATGREIRSTDTAINNERIGKSYNFNNKKVDIPEYEFVGVAGGTSLTGTLEEGEKVITLEYRKKIGTVTVIYKGSDGKELAKEVVKDQKYGTKYTAPKKDFEGYELEGTLPTVTVTKPTETVEVKYRKLGKGRVTVEYVDLDNNGKVIESKDITGEVYENATYTVPQKSFDKYDYVGVRGNTPLQGKVGVGNKKIVLEYKLKLGGITVNYRSGNKVLKSDVLNNLKYGTNKVIDAMQFEGYLPKEKSRTVLINKPMEVVNFDYDRIRNKVNVVYMTEDNEILDKVSKEVFYGDSFTPEKKVFNYMDYVSGADAKTIKGNTELVVRYKYKKAGVVRVVYKHKEKVVRTDVVPTEKNVGTKYKFDPATVGDKFEAEGHKYVKLKHVSGALEGIITDKGVEIVYSVQEETDKTEVREEVIPFEVEYKDDDTLDAGYEKLDRQGSNGKRTITERVVLHDGTEVERHNVSTKEDKPTNKVILRGTKKAPEETSGAVVISYEYKDEQLKETTLLEAGSALGTEYESKLEKGDRIKIKDKLYQVKEIDGDLKGRGTVKAQRIKVKLVEVKVDTKDEEIKIPFETEYVADETLPLNEQKEETAGVEGVTTVTYEITYEDDVEVSKVVKKVVEITKPVKRVVKIGRLGATADTPAIEQPAKPELPEIPKIDEKAKGTFTTRWVVMKDGKEVDLTDAIYSTKEFKDKLEFVGMELVDTKEDKEKQVKTYVYDKKKEPVPPVAEPDNKGDNPDKGNNLDGTPDGKTKDGAGDGDVSGTTQDDVTVGGTSSQGGSLVSSSNGTVVNGVQVGSGSNSVVSGGSRHGSLSSTGLGDTTSTTTAGVITFVGALIAGVLARKREK